MRIACAEHLFDGCMIRGVLFGMYLAEGRNRCNARVWPELVNIAASRLGRRMAEFL
jgi:hypothetical protein